MPYMPERAIPQVARPVRNLARLCCVAPVVGAVGYVILGLLTPSLAEWYVGGHRVLVSAAQLTLLVILVRHPWRRTRPEGLTWVLAMSWILFLPALVTGYWPGVLAAPGVPLLAGALALVERNRDARP
ncbi:hypothetical protein [Streptomyces sp. NPDC058374]|uniref:hypothetical protein n=1 Tax=unclassified Streptomyces TaxID=2593676 RepID=UPI00364FFCED